MSLSRVALIVAATAMAASCSEKSNPDLAKNSPVELKAESGENENDRGPRDDEIAEDCVAFVRSTRFVPPQSSKADCPTCASEAEGAEALAFQQFKTDRISCSGDTCEVDVTLRAKFNPGLAGTITGGLTAWISVDQKTACLAGQSPPGEQTFAVKVIYKRAANGWRAVEFDKAEAR
jgi:hypothetical protein